MEPVIAAPYRPGLVVLSPLSPLAGTEAAPAAQATRVLLGLRQALTAAKVTPLSPAYEQCLLEYAGALLACEGAVAAGQLTFDPLGDAALALPCAIGDDVADTIVTGRGVGYDLFVTLQALVASYARTAQRARFADALVRYQQASELVEAAARVYERHAAVPPPTWPASFRTPALEPAQQRQRGQLLAALAQQAAVGVLVHDFKSPWHEVMPIVHHLVQTYAALGSSAGAGDMAPIAQAQSNLWTARAASILATGAASTHDASAQRLWALVRTVAERAATLHRALRKPADALKHTAAGALDQISEQRLARPLYLSAEPASPEEDNVQQTLLVGSLFAAYLPEAATMETVPSVREQLVALGDAWIVQQGGIDRLAQRHGPDDNAAVPHVAAPPGHVVLARLLNVSEDHAILKHPAAEVGLLQAVAVRAAAVERERRLRLGNDTRTHGAVHSLLSLSATELTRMTGGGGGDSHK
jgi:hypothetical protein